MDGDFELILNGVSDITGYQADNIKQLLEEKYGITPANSMELFDGTRASLAILRSSNTAHLKDASAQLSELGAKVMIVRRKMQVEVEKLPQPQASNSFKSFYENYTNNITRVLQSICVADVEYLVNALTKARQNNKQIFIFGNGGSASTASHMVNDLAKPVFDNDAFSFRVIGLSDNIASITANANDYGYQSIFVNQLRNLLQPEDLVIAISSSGNSANIVQAVEYANTKGAITIGIVGFGGGELSKSAHHSILIPTDKGDYGYHEDVSLILNHIVSLYLRRLDSVQAAKKI
jgi:D-sedoheptulose 7-phosphate isomerase